MSHEWRDRRQFTIFTRLPVDEDSLESSRFKRLFFKNVLKYLCFEVNISQRRHCHPGVQGAFGNLSVEKIAKQKFLA